MKLLIRQHNGKGTFDYVLFQSVDDQEAIQNTPNLTLVQVLFKINELSRQRTHFVIVVETYDSHENMIQVESFTNEYKVLKFDDFEE